MLRQLIDRSLASLLKIREHLVQKQVELADLSDGVLFFVIEFILQGLRQFLTYEERLKAEFGNEPFSPRCAEFRRSSTLRELYFVALGVLREHICGATTQIAAIAGISVPDVPDCLKIKAWETANYVGDGTKSTEYNQIATF